MKPRIYKRDGLWYCDGFKAELIGRQFARGMGFDPFEAYEDWRKKA